MIQASTGHSTPTPSHSHPSAPRGPSTVTSVAGRGLTGTRPKHTNGSPPPAASAGSGPKYAGRVQAARTTIFDKPPVPPSSSGASGRSPARNQARSQSPGDGTGGLSETARSRIGSGRTAAERGSSPGAGDRSFRFTARSVSPPASPSGSPSAGGARPTLASSPSKKAVAAPSAAQHQQQGTDDAGEAWSPRRGEQQKRRGRGSAPGQPGSPGVSPHRTKTFRAPGCFQNQDSDIFAQTWPPVSPRGGGGPKFGNGQGLSSQGAQASPRSSAKNVVVQAAAQVASAQAVPACGSRCMPVVSQNGNSYRPHVPPKAQVSPRRMGSTIVQAAPPTTAWDGGCMTPRQPVHQVYEHSSTATPRQPSCQEQQHQAAAWAALRQASAPRLLQANGVPPPPVHVQCGRAGTLHPGAHTHVIPSNESLAFVAGQPLVQGLHTN